MMRRKFGWIVTCAVVLFVMGIAASSLLACSESCLDEFPCNVPADDSDGSYDGATHVVIDATADVELVDASVADAIDDISTNDDADEIDDAEADASDAADD
jgi:hypothetical protein